MTREAIATDDGMLLETPGEEKQARVHRFSGSAGWLILGLGLSAAPLGLAAETMPSKDVAGRYDVAAFVQRLDTLRREASIPGLAVAVLKDRDVVLATGLGYADVDGEVPATAETAFDVASIAKPLSAVVALRLVEAGVIDLDEPIASYSSWTEFCSDFSRQASIFARELRCQPAIHTLRHLLSHTATGTPGVGFSYNPVLYSWASRPMMAAADAPFSALVDRHVFGPAGMTRSARTHRNLPLREDMARRLAPPYRVDDTGAVQPAPERSAQGDGAAGGVVTTVLDLAKFDVALDRGLLLSPELRHEMMTATRSIDGETVPYGLGWYVQDYGGQTLVWHSGWWEDAYSALYLKIPALELSFIVLANSEGIWWGNPLDEAEVERSVFAQAFFSAFVEP